MPPATVGLVTNSSDLVAVIAELHAALAPGDLAQTLSRVTDAAVELLPDVDGATITVEHADGRFETAAATGCTWTLAARLDRLQQVLDEGPAVDVTDASGSSEAWEGPPRRSGGRACSRAASSRRAHSASTVTRLSLAKRPRSGPPTCPATIAIPPTVSSR